MEIHNHHFVDHGDLSSHYVDGELTSLGIKGLFGTKTYFAPDGQIIGHSEPNLYGGRDVWHGTELIEKSAPTKVGHVDLLGGHDPSVVTKIGSEEMGTDGSGGYVAYDLGHGFSTVMSHADPLLHVGEYTMPPVVQIR